MLVSKNKGDLKVDEKQIQYTMTIRDVRELKRGESQRIWPGNEGSWKYLIEPFDLKDVLGIDSRKYGPPSGSNELVRGMRE